MAAEIRHEMVSCAVDGGGVRLHCAVAGDAGRPLMLFLHGFPEFWAAWRKPIAFFAARGWLCVAPDLKVLRVPEASHWIVHEKPDLVCSEIERFVASWSI